MSSTAIKKPPITVPCKYFWNINRESLENWKNKQTIDSPLFGPENFDMIKFKLRLYYEPDDDCSSGFSYSIDLILVSSLEPYVDLRYRIFVKQTLNINKKKSVFKQVEFSEYFIEEQIVIDSFKICPSVESVNCEIQIQIPDKQGSQFRTLITDLNSLRLNSRFTDVTFVVGKKEFPANKNILSARSPVFGVMFSRKEFVENQQSRVDITDIDEKVFGALLDFIYTTQVKNMDEIADKLLVAAHKYEIPSLVEMCAQSMIKLICCGNAISFLLHAKMYNLVELKSKTIDYINKNADVITKREDWAKLVEPDNSLMIELYRDLVEKQPET